MKDTTTILIMTLVIMTILITLETVDKIIILTTLVNETLHICFYLFL
jgi:hypothetical protein